MINETMAALIDELADGDVPHPLHQRFVLLNLWADLARLAGEELPVDIAAALVPTLAERVEPVARRGAPADHAPQFAEA